MLLFLFMPGMFGTLHAEGTGNRYNVVIVLDASTSIGLRDPDGLRYEAVRFFTGLLAEKGNYVGTVAFSGAVKDSKPILINSRKDKESVSRQLEKVKLSGETNIGLAIERAVGFLEQLEGNGLDSVILLLSDGNTEMNTHSETVKSEQRRDAAVAAAHSAGIKIYSMCLNVDGRANKGVEELREKVSFRDGEDYFSEVKDTDGLKDAFNDFYERIYGTSTIRSEGRCGADGKFSKNFVIPSLGIEEVNVIVYDQTTEISLYSPDGSKFDCVPMEASSFKIYKITNAIPGRWRIEAQGKSNSLVQINMVYNSNVELEFSVDNENENHGLNPSENASVRARLISDGIYARGNEYSVYEAEVSVLNRRGQRVGSPVKMEMSPDGDGFIADLHFDREDSYSFSVDVKGSTDGFDESAEKFFERTYGPFGPLHVSADQNNTAPFVSEKTIKRAVYKIPFKKSAPVQIKLSDFVSDAQDDSSKLKFEVIESTFPAGEVGVTGDVITFSEDCRSGRLVVTATDSGNLSCSVPVALRKYDVGLMTVILIAAIAFVVVAVLLITLYIALNKRFSGTLKVVSYVDGEYREDSVTKPRGRCPLSKFSIDNIGLNRSKSYFQATGKDFVWFCPNTKVMYAGRESKKIKVFSGSGVRISLKGKEDAYLELKYSRNPNVRTKR